VGNYLVIGGTGTLGQETIRQLLAASPVARITVLSRSEHKHQELKKKYPQVKFVLGDIRDLTHLKREFLNKHAVFHFAALKHVDHAEENPIECVKTNLLGTINVAEACIEAGVRHCVFSSTDKAVDPITVYGNCKAASERILFKYNEAGITRFSVFRWGNVTMSQGSALNTFAECLRRNDPVPVTDPGMTRFWISIEAAVEYLLSTYRDAKAHEAMIHPLMKAAPVTAVIDVIAEILGVPEYQTRTVGLRGTEKIHEALRSRHSSAPVTSASCPQYTRGELYDLVAKTLGGAA
jgi:UDP-N-acetylglucosamine 4,6-dehydratase